MVSEHYRKRARRLGSEQTLRMKYDSSTTLRYYVEYSTSLQLDRAFRCAALLARHAAIREDKRSK